MGGVHCIKKHIATKKWAHDGFDPSTGMLTPPRHLIPGESQIKTARGFYKANTVYWNHIEKDEVRMYVFFPKMSQYLQKVNIKLSMCLQDLSMVWRISVEKR
jgi:hypothetical protein